MGTTQLLDRIRSDARSQVDAIEAERDRQLAAIAERRDREVEVIKQEFRARIERETRLIKDRALSRARLEHRKSLLAAKWAAIDRAFALARDQIRSGADYDALIESVVKRYASGDQVVRFSPEDTSRYREKFGVRVGEPLDIGAGVVIEQGRQSVDFSVDESIAAIRGELAPRLDSVLFPEVPSR